MHPTLHPFDLPQENRSSHGRNQTGNSPRVSRSLSDVRRLRSDGMVPRRQISSIFHPASVPSPAPLHQSISSTEMESTIYSFKYYSESWIEVSSQPSSSSLSSAAADEANPRTLGVQFDQHGRRRRRLLRTVSAQTGMPDHHTNTHEGSSQEEYEESESESDRILTSSNENVEHQIPDGASPQAAAPQSAEASSNEAVDDDDDENATALGVTTNAPVFTPPPNAFSHPSHGYTAQRQTRSLETRASYFPAHRTSPHRRTAAHTHHPNSYPSRSSRTGHTPYNMISPAHQADHDAALRASLSTLLSCAAAARGLPKRDGQSGTLQGTSNASVAGPSNRVEPSSLRLVPASAIAIDPAETEEPQPPQLPPRPPLAVRRQRSATSLASSEKGKRKASSSKDRSNGNKPKKQRRTASPSRRGVEIQPTLLTWFVGAGVVVLFSAISFSAGYAIGREVGRVEAGRAISEEGVVCGREVGKGLRRTLRWGSGSGGLSVIRV